MSNYTLITANAVKSDLTTSANQLIYIPLASKYTHGTVKIGDGLLVDKGVLSFDFTDVDKLKVDYETLNEIVEKITPIVYDNEEKIKSVTEDLAVVKTDVENAVTAATTALVKISKFDDVREELDDAIDTSTKALNNANIAIEAAAIADGKATDALSLVSGVAQNIVFDSYADMIVYINDDSKVKIIGQQFLIRDASVSDYWWDGEQALPLEIDVPSISNMVTTDTLQIITGSKSFTGEMYVGGELINDLVDNVKTLKSEVETALNITFYEDGEL